MDNFNKVLWMILLYIFCILSILSDYFTGFYQEHIQFLENLRIFKFLYNKT